MKEQASKPVVVTTEHKGVFFGYISAAAETDVETIRIERARMAISWSADVRGVTGLAASGPTKGCRIGLPVPAITLRAVTAVIECSADAAEAWEKSPWAL